MRREGFELLVGPPTVITKKVDGETFEPFENVEVQVRSMLQVVLYSRGVGFTPRPFVVALVVVIFYSNDGSCSIGNSSVRVTRSGPFKVLCLWEIGSTQPDRKSH